MEASALRLAEWIRGNYPYPLLDPLTHLKLQKLGFYCYGAALAFEHEQKVGPIAFEAWEHGPVNRQVYGEYREYASKVIPPPSPQAEPYEDSTEVVLRDVLLVYGLLDTWSLRHQSHLEQPWIEARKRPDKVISTGSIREHFVRKFRTAPVQPPEYLFDSGSFRLDGIPVRRNSGNLHQLATFLGRTFAPAKS
jgi:uncharacterized phage-associated protein